MNVKSSPQRRLIILGLDGATFNLIDPLIDAGVLSVFERLKKEGIYGNMESTIPPISSPAWSSFQTGKNPDKHGICSFVKIQSDYSVRINNGSNIKGITFYEHLVNANKNCLIVNLPYTYPPRIKGDLVTSWLTPKEVINDFFYPKTLPEKFPSLKYYKAYPEEGTDIKWLQNCIEVFMRRFDVLEEAIQHHYNFIFFLFSMPDWIQHKVFDEIITSQTKRGRMGLEAFKLLNNRLSNLFESIENDNVIILSDHGFKSYKQQFAINKWLMDEDFLEISNKGELIDLFIRPSGKVFDISFFAKYVKKVPSMMHLVRPIYNWVKKISPVEFQVQPKVDMGSTKAFSPLSEETTIFINDNRFEKPTIHSLEEKQQVKHEIIKKLSKFDFLEVYDKDKIFEGPHIDMFPDIIIYSEEVAITKTFFCNKINSSITSQIQSHDKHGILLAKGPDIKEGQYLNGCRLIDLAPTILHMNDLPVPLDMDGKVLKKIFKENSSCLRRKIKYIKPDNIDLTFKCEKNTKNIEKRLRDLGYI